MSPMCCHYTIPQKIGAIKLQDLIYFGFDMKKLATCKGIEPLSSDRQSDIITIILTSHIEDWDLRTVGFEPTPSRPNLIEIKK